MRKVRGKFVVNQIKRNRHWGGAQIELAAEYDPNLPEDQRYAEATPAGSIEMTVDNPGALEVLALGRTFYVDFIPAEE